jgi:hypothetical protein
MAAPMGAMVGARPPVLSARSRRHRPGETDPVGCRSKRRYGKPMAAQRARAHIRAIAWLSPARQVSVTLGGDTLQRGPVRHQTILFAMP